MYYGNKRKIKLGHIRLSRLGYLKNNFGYNDLKLFGKLEQAENLKSAYQNRMFDKMITYSGNLKWTSINF